MVEYICIIEIINRKKFKSQSLGFALGTNIINFELYNRDNIPWLCIGL